MYDLCNYNLLPRLKIRKRENEESDLAAIKIVCITQIRPIKIKGGQRSVWPILACSRAV